MKVAFLAPANSIHTIRWVNGLSRRGLEIHLISAHDAREGTLDRDVRVHRLDRSAPVAYLFCSRQLAACLEQIQPDLLNVHYASGYGTLARLSCFKPMLLSVWGSDVYDFPAISPVHRWLIRANLHAATAVASTSECMARRAARIFDHPHQFVTPFGVDERVFVPGPAASPAGQIVIGTVKTLARKYGVDVLVDAFALAVQDRRPGLSLRLEITGSGPEEEALRRQVDRLGLAELVTFCGAVPHGQVPGLLQRLDIFAALSRDDSESFGVAAVEAAACARPVVVSDVDGFVEVTREGETALVVPRDDARAAAAALMRLVDDPALRTRLGSAARDRVVRHYTWDISLDRMIEAYRSVVAGPSAAGAQP